MNQKQFEFHFLNNIKPNLVELNRKRKVILFQNYLSFYLIYLIAVTCSFLIPALNDFKISIIITGLLLSLFITWMISPNNRTEGKYYKQLKNIIIPMILEQYSDNIEYQENKYIPAKVFTQSGLTPQRFHKSKGGDLMIVNMQNYKISFSFINILEIVYRNARSTTNRHTSSLYKGEFVIIDIKPSEITKIDLHSQFKGWKYAIDSNRIYLSRESSIKFCEPSLFRNIMKPRTFIKPFNQINGIFNLKLGK